MLAVLPLLQRLPHPCLAPRPARARGPCLCLLCPAQLQSPCLLLSLCLLQAWHLGRRARLWQLLQVQLGLRSRVQASLAAAVLLLLQPLPVELTAGQERLPCLAWMERPCAHVLAELWLWRRWPAAAELMQRWRLAPCQLRWHHGAPCWGML
jgi:hypothetical protein